MKNIFKKILILFLLSFLVSTLDKCAEMKNVQDYQYIFKHEDRIGYGKFKYNSYLLLFPRDTPKSLTDFYYVDYKDIFFQNFSIYFTCTLSKDNYDAFIDGLDNFVVKYGDEERKLLVNTDNFEYKAYIAQWREPTDKWEVFEYILLDDENNTIIFVYTMGMIEHIEKIASYNFTPKDQFFLKDTEYENYSIYKTDNYTNDPLNPNDEFDTAEYDISFLAFLE